MIFPNQLLLFLLSSALFYFFFNFFLKPQESLGEQMGVIKMTHSHINKAKKKKKKQNPSLLLCCNHLKLILQKASCSKILQNTFDTSNNRNKRKTASDAIDQIHLE